MSQELIRSDSVLGTKQVIAGSRDTDFVIQTKGKVKNTARKFLHRLNKGW